MVKSHHTDKQISSLYQKKIRNPFFSHAQVQNREINFKNKKSPPALKLIKHLFKRPVIFFLTEFGVLEKKLLKNSMSKTNSPPHKNS